MAHVIVIKAFGSSTPVVYGPEKDYAAAVELKDKMLAADETLTGEVVGLNSIEAARAELAANVAA